MAKEERAQMVFASPTARRDHKLHNRFEGLSLSVTAKTLKGSVHGDLSCTDCHSDAAAIPHASPLGAVRCSTCHSSQEEAFALSVHARGITHTTSASPLCQDCHGAHDIRRPGDPQSSVYPTRLPKTCAGCHADEELTKKENIAIRQPFKAYAGSIHGKALLERGVLKAPSCTSCHGSHDIRSSTDPSSTIAKGSIPKMCSQCHYGVFTKYMESVHGIGYFTKHTSDSPVCTNCHGEHNIQSPQEPDSTVYAATISKSTCPQCHGVEKINKKYGLASGRVATYQDSYHGLADKFGNTTVANCASCHGDHDIFPSSDPRSRVSGPKLPETCGTCHPGATKNFAVGLVHGGKSPATTFPELVKYYVRTSYILLIILVIGGMAAHNGLDYITKIREHMEHMRHEQQYVRLTRNERYQHAILFTTFISLAVTGFALRYQWELPFLSGDTNLFWRKYIHRGAALLMVAASVYHLYYIVGTRRGRDMLLAMTPVLKDIEDALQQVLFYLGLKKEKARFGRFSYVEKAEYLALLWGSAVMIATGFMMWFEEFAMRYIPKWGLDIADMVHLYEAILASLAVIVWHFYHVHVKPDVSPMNTAWITGTIPEELMKEEHPLELEDIKKGGKE